MLKNYKKISKYLYSKSKNKYKFTLNFLTQKFLINNVLIKIPYHTYCIYTGRNRSIYHNYKMSRHKLKEFLDYRNISNVYVR